MPSSAPHRVREEMNLPAEDCVPAGGYKQCSHGRCLNHHPEWERIEDNIFIPLSFWQRLRSRAHTGGPYPKCCGKRMAISVFCTRQKCQKCARTRLSYFASWVYICSCCGFKRTIATHPTIIDKIFGKE